MEPVGLTWAYQSAISSTMTTDLPLGLVLAEANTVLYSVGSQANQYYISRFTSLSSNPPTLSWTQKFTVPQPFTSCFLTHIQGATFNSLIVSGPSSMNFVILQISGGGVTGGTSIYDASQTGLITTLDVLATSPTSLSALVYGTLASSSTQQVYIALVDFSIY